MVKNQLKEKDKTNNIYNENIAEEPLSSCISHQLLDGREMKERLVCFFKQDSWGLQLTLWKASGSHLVQTPPFPDKENEIRGHAGRFPKSHSQLSEKAKSYPQAPGSIPVPSRHPLLPFWMEPVPGMGADVVTRYDSRNGTAIFTEVTPLDGIHMPLLCSVLFAPGPPLLPTLAKSNKAQIRNAIPELPKPGSGVNTIQQVSQLMPSNWSQAAHWLLSRPWVPVTGSALPLGW